MLKVIPSPSSQLSVSAEHFNRILSTCLEPCLGAQVQREPEGIRRDSHTVTLSSGAWIVVVVVFASPPIEGVSERSLSGAPVCVRLSCVKR